MFERIVFAGGGHRCWWQAGWWDVAAPAAGLAPVEIAGVSAGAATACLVFANDSRVALDYYRRVLGNDAKNAYWQRWREGASQVFPHEGIYRQALHTLLGQGHFDRLQRCAPTIRVAYARPPALVPVSVAVGLGLLAYNTEKYLFKPLHPKLGRRLGFRPEVATVQACRNPDELVDLIIASSCTPPFTRIQLRHGKPTIDGGLVDNVPVHALSDRPHADAANSSLANASSGNEPDTLVLVTRRYPEREAVFQVGSHVYVQPTKKVTAASWDYTSPADYEATYAQGRDDAVHFLDWLHHKSRP